MFIFGIALYRYYTIYYNHRHIVKDTHNNRFFRSTGHTGVIKVVPFIQSMILTICSVWNIWTYWISVLNNIYTYPYYILDSLHHGGFELKCIVGTNNRYKNLELEVRNKWCLTIFTLLEKGCLSIMSFKIKIILQQNGNRMLGVANIPNGWYWSLQSHSLWTNVTEERGAY